MEGMDEADREKDKRGGGDRERYVKMGKGEKEREDYMS